MTNPTPGPRVHRANHTIGYSGEIQGSCARLLNLWREEGVMNAGTKEQDDLIEMVVRLVDNYAPYKEIVEAVEQFNGFATALRKSGLEAPCPLTTNPMRLKFADEATIGDVLRLVDTAKRAKSGGINATWRR